MRVLLPLFALLRPGRNLRPRESRELVQNAGYKSHGIVASIVGVVTLLFGAAGVALSA